MKKKSSPFSELSCFLCAGIFLGATLTGEAKVALIAGLGFLVCFAITELGEP